MWHDRQAMFDNGEAMFDDRKAMLKSLCGGGGGGGVQFIQNCHSHSPVWL